MPFATYEQAMAQKEQMLPADRENALRFGAMLFAGFIVTALVLGWLMYPFPL